MNWDDNLGCSSGLLFFWIAFAEQSFHIVQTIAKLLKAGELQMV